MWWIFQVKIEENGKRSIAVTANTEDTTENESTHNMSFESTSTNYESHLEIDVTPTVAAKSKRRTTRGRPKKRKSTEPEEVKQEWNLNIYSSIYKLLYLDFPGDYQALSKKIRSSKIRAVDVLDIFRVEIVNIVNWILTSVKAYWKGVCSYLHILLGCISQSLSTFWYIQVLD